MELVLKEPVEEFVGTEGDGVSRDEEMEKTGNYYLPFIVIAY